MPPLRRTRSSSELGQPLDRLSFALHDDGGLLVSTYDEDPMSMDSRPASSRSRENVANDFDVATTGGDLMEMDNLPILDSAAITRLISLTPSVFQASTSLAALKDEMRMRIANCTRVLAYLDDQKSYMAIETEKKNLKIQELVHSLSSLKSSPRSNAVSSASGRLQSSLRPFGLL